MIESINNEKIKNYAKLKDKKFRDKENMFIIEGEHLVEEAKLAGLLVESFSLDGSIGTKVSDAVMKKLSSLTNIPKVLGIARKCPIKDANGNILILDDIQDPGNLGTIIRSSVAFNIDTIVASPNTVDIYNAKVVRSTEGLLFKVNYVMADLTDFLKENKDKYTIYTTNVNEGISLKDIKPKYPFALIMGNEGMGVKSDIASLAHESINIPINNNCESLNVAIATSIILYEFNTRN